ncbi:MAG: FtsX-like permease family protein [Bacteroidota bacterium]
MLKSYLKIAYRNLLKNKVFSLINILGLAIGMAACLLILQYVRFELSYEDFHTNADNIYRVTLDLYNGSEFIETDCETYGNLGPYLTEQHPEVLNFVRFYNYESIEVKVKDQKFIEDRLYFADSSAFTVFTYEVIHGNPTTALSFPFQTVLTTSTAQKYFGRTDVVGEAIEIDNKPYQVTAIIADVPLNTHLKFDFLLSHTTVGKIWRWYDKNTWNSNNEYTYLLMAPGTDLAEFNQKLTDLSISLKDEVGDERFVAEPINDIHLYSNKTFEPEVNGSARTVYFLLIIAIFIITIAWVNYVNLSTARSVDRAREVGIRKVMGSGRSQLIRQFLLESAIISLLAGGIALTIVQFSLPVFRSITAQPLSLSIAHDAMFWYLLGGLILVGALLSGIYPALVLSSFQPTTVLKGKLRTSTHGRWLRQGMVIFQFATTVVLIIGTSTVYLQVNHLRNQDLGMDITQTLAVHTPSLGVPDSVYISQLQSFKNELLRLSTVEQVARSSSLPGLSLHQLGTSTGIRKVGEDAANNSYNYYLVRIDEDYASTLDIELIAGRNFEPGLSNYEKVLINEEAVSKLGFNSPEEAIGAKITYYWKHGEPSIISGVLSNYHQRSPKEAHIPMVFPYTAGGSYLTLRLSTEELPNTLAEIKDQWQQAFPNSAFTYFFVNDTYDQQYRADTRFGQIVAIFSGLAIFIACLGLFGLSSFTVLQRTKEIGVRKILGATIGQIFRLLSYDFIRLVLAAGLLALPIGYFVMQNWLANYATRIDLHWWIFLTPTLLILLIALLTISFQTIRAALANPADSLRYE